MWNNLYWLNQAVKIVNKALMRCKEMKMFQKENPHRKRKLKKKSINYMHNKTMLPRATIFMIKHQKFYRMMQTLMPHKTKFLIKDKKFKLKILILMWLMWIKLCLALKNKTFQQLPRKKYWNVHSTKVNKKILKILKPEGEMKMKWLVLITKILTDPFFKSKFEFH